MGHVPAPWFWEARDGWYVKLDRRRVSLKVKGKKNEAEAHRAFHRLLAERGHPLAAAPGGAGGEALRVDLLCDLHLEACKDGWSPETYDRTRRDLKAFVKRWGALKAAELKPLHVTKWLAEATTWGSSSKSRAVASVKGAFAWAVREGHLAADPIKAVAKPEMKVRRQVLTDAQFAAALAATPDEAFRDFLTVLRETGCRPGEVKKLAAEDVFPEQRVWSIDHKARVAQGGRLRTVPLSDAALAITLKWAGRNPTGPIFRNTKGRPWTRRAWAGRWWHLREKLGYGPEATAYAVRHRFATQGLIDGVSNVEMAALLGHSSTAMIDRHYSHVSDSAKFLRDAMAKARPTTPAPAAPPPAPDAPKARRPARPKARRPRPRRPPR